MAGVSELDKQEIVHDTLQKAFDKLLRKGLLPADKVAELSAAHLEARGALIAAEVVRLQTQNQRVEARLESQRARLARIRAAAAGEAAAPRARKPERE